MSYQDAITIIGHRHIDSSDEVVIALAVHLPRLEEADEAGHPVELASQVGQVIIDVAAPYTGKTSRKGPNPAENRD